MYKPTASVKMLIVMNGLCKLLYIFAIIFILTIASSNGTTNMRILSCTASYNQPDYHCAESMDGYYTGDSSNGWAVAGAGFPQNVVYELEELVYLDHVRIITAVNRNNHFLTAISLEEEFLDTLFTSF